MEEATRELRNHQEELKQEMRELERELRDQEFRCRTARIQRYSATRSR